MRARELRNLSEASARRLMARDLEMPLHVALGLDMHTLVAVVGTWQDIDGEMQATKKGGGPCRSKRATRRPR